MPDEAYWESFFNAEEALDVLLGAGSLTGDIVEFGCGYGTFTLPAGRRTQGIVTALDIEPQMVTRVREKAVQLDLPNVHTSLRDFVTEGTGLKTGSQAYALMFNLLHMERPVALLQEAHRALVPGGQIAIMHWRSDISTPRGPSAEIRPSPEHCRAWLEEADFYDISVVDLHPSCPYHFGMVATR
jgi:SAM-dependent methyltransferase